MGLRGLSLQPYYRTGANDLVRDFYRPCLQTAAKYDRAVGYFTSTSLAAAAAGLKPFISRPGTTMRLVASPALTHEDAEAIKAGYDLRELVAAALSREIEKAVPDAVSQRLELLTWLIANQRLELKLAVVSNTQGVGIYHEKIGIFSDAEDSVVFTGSANESASGLIANFESIEVFRSWIPGEQERVSRRQDDFNQLWDNSTPGLEVMTFPEAAKRQLLLRYTPRTDIETLSDGDEPAQTLPSTGLHRPIDLELRDYQKEAIERWWSAGGRGIWEMATGTGKTITALAATVAVWDVYRKSRSLLVVITVPYTHLADQWAKEVKKFGGSPIRAYGTSARWTSQMDSAVAASAGREPRLTVIIAVNRTFCGKEFQDRLRLAPCDKLLISDEAHTAGSRNMREALPANIKFRLGLSATPDRHLDQDGTAAIRKYFGRSVYQLGLKRAISLGALVNYTYHPVVVELTAEEHDEYVEITQKISRAIGLNGDIDPDDAPSGLELLLFQRARLIGSASQKISALRSAIEPYRSETHTLVYCSDRTGPEPQLNQVLALLGHELRMRVNTFTAEEDPEARADILERFSSGDLQAIAAIRCLDEGVDIPATRRAFILASSQNPRQFIQRRGRVLRKAPGKSSAEIFDFIVSPPDLSDDPALFAIERRLVGRELVRAVELCDAATNTIEALSILRPLRSRYDLLSLAPPSDLNDDSPTSIE